MTNAPNKRAATQESSERRDYLHEHSRKAVLILAAAAVGLVIASMKSADSADGLSSIALGWPFAHAIIRAALVFAVVATIVIVLLRGWGGIWPERISTSGFDYGKISEASADLGHQEARISKLKAELEEAQSQSEGG